MTAASPDLHVLTADTDMLETIDGMLSRPKSLGIRSLVYTVDRHAQRDPGCRTAAESHLRGLRGTYDHALVIFDKEGCGRDDAAREEIEEEVERQLHTSGWGDRAKVIVIEPELETWVWQASPHVADTLGWRTYHELKSWLTEKGHWPPGAAKPPDPKAAMLAALKEKRRQHSSALFRKLARRVSLRHCQCPAFREFRRTLVRWFPVEPA